MFVAKWSWRNEYKVFLIDGTIKADAYYTDIDVVGHAGTLDVEEVIFEDVKSGFRTGSIVHDIAMIMASY